MANFSPAFDFMMQHEDPKRGGKVTDDPTHDCPGAIARFGINSAAHHQALSDGFYIMPTDKALEYAADVYRNEYWCRIGGFQITDQKVANKYFDLAVNSGVKEATKIMQRAVNSLCLPNEIGLRIDGYPGMRTIDGINKSMPSVLLERIKYYAKDFYQAWAMRDNIPSTELDALLRRVAA